MHDIKYFFLNKNNQTIQKEQKKIPKGGQITESITEKHYFSKFREARAPLDTLRSAPDLRCFPRISIVEERVEGVWGKLDGGGDPVKEIQRPAPIVGVERKCV
jgi:hypothetical protein